MPEQTDAEMFLMNMDRLRIVAQIVPNQEIVMSRPIDTLNKACRPRAAGDGGLAEQFAGRDEGDPSLKSRGG
jgi:hypothetical protein